MGFGSWVVKRGRQYCVFRRVKVCISHLTEARCWTQVYQTKERTEVCTLQLRFVIQDIQRFDPSS